jgi:hypothetical protein
VETELFYANRRTDIHDEANSCFRSFANAPNKVKGQDIHVHDIKAYTGSKDMIPPI